MLLRSQPESEQRTARCFPEAPEGAFADPAQEAIERRPGGTAAHLEAARALFRAMAAELLYSYSYLLFVRSRLVGLVLLLTSFLNVSLGLSGILSWLATICFARLIGIKKGDPVHTVYGYNALIVGFSIGFLFKLSLLSFLLTIGTSVLTVLLSFSLYSLLSVRHKLPVLNLPFLIVSSIVYLASARFSSLSVASFYAHSNLNLDLLPAFIQGFLRALGIIIFMPYDLCGMLVLASLLCFSRIAFFLAVVSYYLGITSLGLFTGSFPNAYLDVYSFNFILTGMALGGVFLIPSRRSYALACAGVFVSVFVLDAASVVWSTFGVPVFTLPFNIVTLLFIYALVHSGYPEVAVYIKASPEASLTSHLNFAQRFDRIAPRPFLPFSGRWTVYQGFDGKWTHKGIWKYAYDFVMEDEQGRTYRNEGTVPEDYFCYGKPILSPVDGTVVDAGDSLEDNAIGEIDKNNNWGNYIIIYSPFGYYVELSHLQSRSVKVKAGDKVSVGEVLAACGNSGYSPQPHVHMQVQYLPRLGSETAKFYFSNCLDGNGRLVEDLPLADGALVEPFSFSRPSSRVLTFVLDDAFTYRLYRDGREAGEIRLKVKMAPDGTYYFGVEGTEDRLYFGFENNLFVFYSFEGKRNSPLEFLFSALPKAPICDERPVGWVDVIPGNVLFRKSAFHLFLKSFHHGAGRTTGSYRFGDQGEVTGVLSDGRRSARTKIVFDIKKGFKEVCVETSDGTHTLVKVEQ